jgi:hypothetical protein
LVVAELVQRALGGDQVRRGGGRRRGGHGRGIGGLRLEVDGGALGDGAGVGREAGADAHRPGLGLGVAGAAGDQVPLVGLGRVHADAVAVLVDGGEVELAVQ